MENFAGEVDIIVNIGATYLREDAPESAIREGKPARARLLNSHSRFSVWSDNQIRPPLLTRDMKRVPCPGVLNDATMDFIDDVRGSDSPYPKCVRLSDIRDVQEVRVVSEAPITSHYAPPTVVEYLLTLVDGSQKTVYAYTQGYFEGYAFEVYETVEEAQSL